MKFVVKYYLLTRDEPAMKSADTGQRISFLTTVNWRYQECP